MSPRTFALPVAILALAACAGGTAPPAEPTPSSNTAPTPAPAPADTAFPTTAPEPGPTPSLTLPDPVRRTLTNGLEVLYVPHGTVPVVTAMLVTRGALADEPEELAGLAAFTAEMLDEGAGGRDALEIAATLSSLGASLGTSAGWDAAYVNLYSLRDRFGDALAIMADVVVRPDFPQAEVDRLKEQELTNLARAADESRIIAANAFSSLVFGDAHPYGRITGTETVERIDRAALERFHARYYRPGGSTLVLVGDVDPAALQPLVEDAFGDWTGAAPEVPSIARAPEPEATRIFLVDKPGAAQSEIRIGHPGVARDDPDYFPLTVLNTILGGSFTSRLNTNLRETHGFSYGASSSYSMRLGAGPFTASSAVFTAKTDSAVVEFFNELRRIREEPVDTDELERAKRYVALGFPRRFETTRGVAGQIADLVSYDLPLDYYNRYVERVMAVSAAEVQRVAREYVRPDRAVVVVVGDRETIEPGLRALGIAPVEVRAAGEFVR